MIKLVTQTLVLAGLLILPSTVQSYKIAVVNDIHGDVNYVPTSALCISKTLPPAEPKKLRASDAAD